MKIPPALSPTALDLTRDLKRNAAPLRPLGPSDLNPASRFIEPGQAGSQHEKLAEQAQLWVAQTFVGTLLKQMEDSPFRSELFGGGRGGQMFSSLHHQQLVQRMAPRLTNKLTDSIVRRIEAKAAYEASGSAVQGPAKSQKSREQANPNPNGDPQPNLKKSAGRSHVGSRFGRHVLNQAA